MAWTTTVEVPSDPPSGCRSIDVSDDQQADGQSYITADGSAGSLAGAVQPTEGQALCWALAPAQRTLTLREVRTAHIHRHAQ